MRSFLDIFNRKRKECGLLPHIRQDVAYIHQNMQFYPWPILTFDVKKHWRFSMGEDIKIAVLDTGCDSNHEDIKSNILDGKNILSNNDNFMDDNGHGTHVAGTTAASHNSLGVVGVAPKSQIVPVKVLGGDGSGSNIDVAKGIVWAVDRGVDIITMSLGSPYPSKPLEDAISYAKQKKTLIVCAAGNAGNDQDIMYPAKYPYTISIGAISKDLTLSKFSCTGSSLDFVAPGEDIPSCIPGNQYALMSGTSMANPYAVGCIAILMGYLKKQSKDYRLTREKFLEILSKYTKHLIQKEYAGIREKEGYGIIQPVTTQE